MQKIERIEFMNNLTQEEKEAIKKSLYSMTQRIGNILAWDYLDNDGVHAFFECMQYDLRDCLELTKKTIEE
jgi:hypothetical protein